jgi:cation diffusion facilitator CzcD-associated flavoprotein CzcO
LPAEVVSHTSQHDNFRQFRGKQVAVIGRGQSACESAVLLKEAGAEVELVCRGPIHWLGVPSADEQSQLRWRVRELLTAPSAIGPFPFNWVAELPGLARHLPLESRKWFSDRALRAGAARWLLPRFDGIQINTGRTIAGTRMQCGHVQLQLDEGISKCDHVLLATGYRIDISKIGVLAPGLLERIARIDGSPLLSRGFESNVAGLHFIGASAVASFGPMMRFIAGSGYAARNVTRAVLTGRTRTRQQPVEKGKHFREVTLGPRLQCADSMKSIRSRHKNGPHPEDVTRSLLRATVSKDGRWEWRLWPSFETACAEEARASSGRGRRYFDRIRTSEMLH